MWSNFDEVILKKSNKNEQIFCLPMEFDYQLPLYDQKKNLHEDNLLVEHWLIFKTSLKRK